MFHSLNHKGRNKSQTPTALLSWHSPAHPDLSGANSVTTRTCVACSLLALWLGGVAGCHVWASPPWSSPGGHWRCLLNCVVMQEPESFVFYTKAAFQHHLLAYRLLTVPPISYPRFLACEPSFMLLTPPETPFCFLSLILQERERTPFSCSLSHSSGT